MISCFASPNLPLPVAQDFPTAGQSLEVKTRAPNNVIFKVAGTRDAKSEAIAGELEGKYFDPKNGLTFTQAWTTRNQLKSTVELENQIAKGLKLDVNTVLEPETGQLRIARLSCV